MLCATALLAAGSSGATTLPRFPANAVWYQDVSPAAFKHPNSDNMLNHLSSLGGWGTGATHLQIDFSFYVLHANNGIPTTQVTPLGGADSYYYPDCGDFHTPLQAPKPLPIPLPPGGGIEGTGPPYVSGSPSYTCDNLDDDCHMLIVQGTTLFESGNSNVSGGKVEAECALTWDLNKVYPRQGRGEQCTSTDAAGYPVAALLFNADEMFAAEQVTSGDLGHAIRFILPNSRMKNGAYVHPANHGTKAPNGASDNDPNAIPYGSRLRLKASYSVATFTAGNHTDGGSAADTAARVLLRTLQKYGMVLSDGGSVPLTAESDYYTTHKWSEFGMDPNTQTGAQVLFGLQVTDFEVVYTGPQITLTYDCVPTPYDFIFIDGFDY
jgi:hypothetical protein